MNEKHLEKLKYFGCELLEEYMKLDNSKIRIKKRKRYIVRNIDNGYMFDINSEELMHQETLNICSPSNPYSIINIPIYLKINNKNHTLLKERSFYKDSKTKTLWFKCLNCTDEFDMSWNEITAEHNCPFCSGKRAGKFNNLLLLEPELCLEWDKDKNEFGPENYVKCSGYNAFWICKDCDYSWQTKISQRTSCRSGCPRCNNKVLFDNQSFGDLFPELLIQYDKDKNIEDPFTIFPKSGRRFWWLCDKCNHSWQAVLSSRSGKMKRGCPCCAGFVSNDINNFEISSPELLCEWNYELNGDPKDYTPRSGKKVWWTCSTCDFEWESTICHRTTMRSGCPKCKESHGEKEVSRILLENNILFIRQKTYIDCKWQRELPFDFYLPDYNLLIEYDGILHFIDKFKDPEEFKKIQYRDYLKNKYCDDNNIPLLRIHYKDFGNIESILIYELGL